MRTVRRDRERSEVDREMSAEGWSSSRNPGRSLKIFGSAVSGRAVAGRRKGLHPDGAWLGVPLCPPARVSPGGWRSRGRYSERGDETLGVQEDSVS